MSRSIRFCCFIMILCICLISATALAENASDQLAEKYAEAEQLLAEGNYDEAAAKFDAQGAYSDASKMAVYSKALAAAETNNLYSSASDTFKQLGDFRDCKQLAYYYAGRESEDTGDAVLNTIATASYEDLTRAAAFYDSAIEIYSELASFKDCMERATYCAEKKGRIEEKQAAAFPPATEEAAAETASDFPAGSPDEVAAVILHTNDIHAGYADYIGYDGLVLYKKELELLYKNVLLVDAGDAVQGTAIASLSEGTEIIRMMNRAGYDLAIPGNHEFDFGFEALDNCAELLSCDYICANFCTADGEPVFRPWKILEAGGLKIGFVAVVTPDTFTKSRIRNIVNEVGEPMYDFLADDTGDRLCDALQKNIDEVRANGADYVILIAHLGSDTKAPSIYSSNAVVGKLSGLDMVIDGHTHEVYNTQIPDREGRMIPIAQAGEKMKAFGQLTIYRDGHLEETLVDLVSAVSDIPSELVQRRKTDRYVDPEMKAFLDEITTSYEPALEQKIGYNPTDMIVWDGVRDYNRTEENGLCELVADSQRALTGAQATVIHAGSVRNNLNAGEITFQDALNTLPYYNEIVKVSVSGQMILDALEFSVSFLPKPVGGFLQVSGLSFSVDLDLESSVRKDEKNQFVCVDGEYRVHDVKIGDRNLDPKAEYTLSTNMFLLTGGDGYTMFKEADILETLLLSDNEVLVKYIEENLGGMIPEKYGKPLGRIQWTSRNSSDSVLQ